MRAEDCRPFAVPAWLRAFRSVIPAMEKVCPCIEISTPAGEVKSIFEEDNFAGDGVFFPLGEWGH